MSSTFSVVKTLIIPAVISLLLFLLFSYVILPVWRTYRSRYSQYLPLDSISGQTQSLRQRISGRLSRLTLPSAWRWRPREVVLAGDGASDSGEELGAVDAQAWHRVQSRGGSGQSETSRLSRDLEEGFMDDSDDDSDL